MMATPHKKRLICASDKTNPTYTPITRDNTQTQRENNMEFLEKDLEDIIYNAPAKEIFERGLWTFTHDILLRQVNLGKYGIADLIGISFYPDRKIVITVYELKLKTINTAALLQGISYAAGASHTASFLGLKKRTVECEIVLIGSKVDYSNQFCFASGVFRNLLYFTYEYDYNGILFKSGNNIEWNNYQPSLGTIIELQDGARSAYKKHLETIKNLNCG